MKVKDGYTLYALKMVYGGLGAFVMVNFIVMIRVVNQRVLSQKNTHRCCSYWWTRR